MFADRSAEWPLVSPSLRKCIMRHHGPGIGPRIVCLFLCRFSGLQVGESGVGRPRFPRLSHLRYFPKADPLETNRRPSATLRFTYPGGLDQQPYDSGPGGRSPGPVKAGTLMHELGKPGLPDDELPRCIGGSCST